MMAEKEHRLKERHLLNTSRTNINQLEKRAIEKLKKLKFQLADYN